MDIVFRRSSAQNLTRDELDVEVVIRHPQATVDDLAAALGIDGTDLESGLAIGGRHVAPDVPLAEADLYQGAVVSPVPRGRGRPAPRRAAGGGDGPGRGRRAVAGPC